MGLYTSTREVRLPFSALAAYTRMREPVHLVAHGRGRPVVRASSAGEKRISVPLSARQGANGESQEQISGAARTAQAPISLLLLAQKTRRAYLPVQRVRTAPPTGRADLPCLGVSILALSLIEQHLETARTASGVADQPLGGKYGRAA